KTRSASIPASSSQIHNSYLLCYNSLDGFDLDTVSISLRNRICLLLSSTLDECDRNSSKF
ncbi:MAG TPA: hypothetical protein VIQ31_10550, partial [Phormidium sp.]